jgi:uncharacterized protein
MTHATSNSGRIVDLDLPLAASIDIRDIAVQLACTNRFNGATIAKGGGPYSVAQHSVVVARIAQQLKARHPLLHLQALLHDAHEAFTGDVTTPMKRALGCQAGEALRRVQFNLDLAIHEAVGIEMPGSYDDGLIARADAIALATEWRDLMPGPCPVAHAPANFAITPLPWPRAEELFLKTFNRLSVAAGILNPSAKTFTPVPTGILK